MKLPGGLGMQGGWDAYRLQEQMHSNARIGFTYTADMNVKTLAFARLNPGHDGPMQAGGGCRGIPLWERLQCRACSRLGVSGSALNVSSHPNQRRVAGGSCQGLKVGSCCKGTQSSPCQSSTPTRESCQAIITRRGWLSGMGC